MLTDAHPPQSPPSLAQLAREQSLQRILRKGLPPFRQTALELAKAVGGASPDLKKAGKLISADPTLSSQVLRMCNSPLLGLHSRVISIDHAAALLGPERLGSLALTTSVGGFAGKVLSESQMSAFWQHSFMAATLSQYLAERWKYFEKYQAYIAGLLHDIGQVPEWMLLIECAGEPVAPPSGWVDNPSVEQEYFGIDHCKLGATMARSWDLMPSFLDVLENHHTPELAQRDSTLVRIVGTVEFFLLGRDAIQPSPGSSMPPAGDSVLLENIQKMRQCGESLFGETEWPRVEEELEQEYARILPIARAGLNDLVTKSNDDSESDAARVSRPALQPDRDPGPRLPKTSSLATPRAGVQTVPSVPTSDTFLSRCKSFIEQLFS